MKAVILAGGLGTRISEETDSRPKPMVEVGGRPLLWHIMKIYSYYGINDFIICCGYKGYMIKEYFANYFLHMSDVTFDMRDNSMHVHQKHAEPWKVTLVDTGESTMTGGRLKRVKEYLGNDKDFCMTYGDGLADIDLAKEIDFHASHTKKVTIAAVTPQGRYGALELSGSQVCNFIEKPKGDGNLINGGFFVLSSDCLDYIKDDNTSWEKEPLINLTQENEVMAFEHSGFWQPMDTLREKKYLEALWETGEAPWKRW